MRAALVSLILLAASIAGAVDYVKLNQELRTARSRQEVQRLLKAYRVSTQGDADLANKAGQAIAAAVPDESLINQIRADVRLRALASGAPDAARVDVDRLKRTKESPLYHDPGTRQSANWLQKSMESLSDWLRRLFERPRGKSPQVKAPQVSIVPGVLTTIVWLVIGAVAVAAIFLIVTLVARSRRSVQRDKGLLSDAEAKLSIDEWLAQADALIRQGDYRGAVRCLYVACLLRLDQSNALEFRRYETNWEHYSRYQDNPQKPRFDLAAPTRDFDAIWYGHRLKGLEDAERFKGFYMALLQALRESRAA